MLLSLGSPEACADVEPVCSPPSSPERDACYASGCCCYGATCTGDACCAGDERAAKKAAYGCAGDDVPVALPPTGLIGFSIFDLDTGASGDYAEVSARRLLKSQSSMTLPIGIL